MGRALILILLCQLLAPVRAQEGEADTNAETRRTILELIATCRAAPQHERAVAEVALGDALVRLGDDAAPILRELLAAGDFDLPRNGLARGLAGLGRPAAFKSAREWMTAEESPPRRAAVAVFRALADDDAVPMIVACMQDRNHRVRRDAVEAARHLGKTERDRDAFVSSISFALRRTGRPGEMIRVAAEFGGTRAHRLVLSQLDRSDVVFVRAALREIHRFGTEEDIAAVLPFLEDDRVKIRREACLAAGRLRAREAVEDLIAVLEEERDRGLRGNALWALREITSQSLGMHAQLWRRWWDAHKDDELEDAGGD